MFFEQPPLRTDFFEPPGKKLAFPWARYFTRVSEVLGKAPQITAVPASAVAPGTPGQVAYNTTHLYICVAKDVWRRVAVVAW